MSKWIQKFKTSSDLAREDSETELQWRFNPPATESELKRLESHLGAPIPQGLRQFLLEANGIQILDASWGDEWRPLFFSVEQMLTDVVEYLETSGNPMPPEEELRSVAFFSHHNGFSYLNAICIRNFAEFCAGDVVYLEHDSGEWSKIADSLEEFLLDPYNCCLA
jgi:SMI1 / KNR4 family (SUKH-1)